jgi:hypothetical protein
MAVTDSQSISTLTYPSPSVRPAPLADRVLALADRHRAVLFVLVLGYALLGFNGQWRLEPDSALYLTIGRNLAQGRGYTYNGAKHHLAFPGPPYLFAGVFKLFHGDNLVPHLVLMLLIGFATLALTYRLFLLYADRPTAVLITFGLGISRLFYRYCFELLSDMPFLLGVVAFLAGYEAIFHRGGLDADRRRRRPVAWYDWVLFLGGLMVAVVMRPSMWALLVAVLLALIWSVVRGPRRWPPILTCLAIIVVAVIFWKLDPRHADNSLGNYEDSLFEVKFSHLSTLAHDMFFENAPRLFEASLCQALFGARLGAGLNTLAGITVLGLGVSLFWHRPLWGLWVAMTVAMVLVAATPMDRYFLQVLPLLVFAWWSAIRWLNHRIPGEWGNRIFVGLFLLGGAVNLMRGGEFIVEQRWVPFLNHYKEGRFVGIHQVARLVRDHVGSDGLVLAPPKQARILSFLSERRAIEPTPENRSIDPDREAVYVLEPLDDPVRQWLRDNKAHLGPQIGPIVENRLAPITWKLHRALPGAAAPVSGRLQREGEAPPEPSLAGAERAARPEPRPPG